MANDRQERAARAEQMRKEREKANRKQRNLITVGIVVIVIALIAVAGVAIKSTSDDRKKNETLVNPTGANKDFGIVYTSKDATGKAPAADAKPVRVTLYEDFLCPGCGALEQTAGSFLSQQVKDGNIDIEYRPYAFLTQQSTNEYSQRAWNAAVCVFDKGGAKAFKAYHDILFANQPEEGGPGPENDQLVAWAKEAGVTGIDKCVTKQTFTPWVEDALEHGKDDGVSGTPTMRIGGKDVSGKDNTIPTVADIQKAIDAAKKS